MSTTQTSADDTALRRFRAATIETALADARAELGDVEIVEANRIRRGGVGGFFATDLGVELVVRTPVPARAGQDELALADPDESEYVDSTDVGGARPELHLPRARPRSADGRPPFYDRVREEDRPHSPMPSTSKPATSTPSTGATATMSTSTSAQPARVDRAIDRSTTAELERLLTSAQHAEQVRTGRSRSFASHLAEQLGRPDDPGSPPDGPAPVTTANEPVIDEPAEPAVDGRTAAEPAAETAAEPAADTATEPETPTTGTAAARRSTAPTGRDPWRRSIDLAAGAVGRLVEQLSDVTPVEGSRMQTLSRLTVSVTTPDGAVIELTAELEGDG